MKRLITALLIAAVFVGCGESTTTTTPVAPSPAKECPAPESGPQVNNEESVPDAGCVAALAPGQIAGVFAPSVGPLSTSYANGRFPSSAISPATGCSTGLANNAAAAWNHVAVIVHEHTGYWLQSNGPASCYRTYDQQVALRNQWCNAGNCSNAAVPGTSNHGWGIAVDAPPQTVAYIHQYAGGLFGQGYGSCSDAQWEDWHVKYCGGYSGSDPGPYGSGGGGGHVFHTLKLHSKGPRVSKLSTHLALLTNLNDKAPHYLAWSKRSKVYTRSIKHGVRRLQHDGKLGTDGIYGPKTAEYQANRWHHFCKVHSPKPEACK